MIKLCCGAFSVIRKKLICVTSVKNLSDFNNLKDRSFRLELCCFEHVVQK